MASIHLPYLRPYYLYPNIRLSTLHRHLHRLKKHLLRYSHTVSSSTTDLGRAYLLNLMNLREATADEVTRAKEGATSGTTNQFTPTFKVGPGERPVKVNEYGFDTGATSGFWVVPK